MIPHYCYHFSSFGFQLLVRTTQVASTAAADTMDDIVGQL